MLRHKLRHLKRILIVFLVLISLNSLAGEYKILLINSYHNTLSWTDSLNYGFISTLKQNKLDFEIYVENLDYKRNKNINYQNEFVSYLKAKYSTLEIKLLFVTDNDALTFIESIHDSIFPNTPVVFCGVNNRYVFQKNYTGIIEQVDVKKNLDLIAQLHPNIDTLYCVVDRTTTGIILDKQIAESVSKNKYQFSTVTLTDLTIDELIKKVKGFEKNAAILFLLFNQDNKGEYFSYEEALDSVSKYAKVPIYGTWGFYLNHGIVGGEIISGYEHGKQAGELALKIINGKPVENLSAFAGNTKMIFDYRAMKKHKIGLTKVPKGSIILHNPLEYIKRNKVEIFLTMTIVLILLVIIYLLIIINKSGKKHIEIHKSYNQELKIKNAQIIESLSKAEEANNLKSAFLANMSHEIRTPMNAIMGFSRLVLLKKDLSRSEIDNFLNIVADNSQKLLNLINDIIDISKIEVNQLKFNISKANINEIVRNCFNIAEVERARLEKNDLNLNITFSVNTDSVIVDTDADRIHQVIMNLVNNALKFTEKGSITIGYDIQDKWIEVFVQDTGVGIDEQHKSIIFDRFRQIETPLNRKYGGSGLGLSICKGIINGLGGEIGVKSELGVGSTFWFRIPNTCSISDANTSKLENSDLKIRSFENKSILIVEDNFVSSKLLVEILKHTKAELILSNSAEEAIEICRTNNKIDLVLMDIQLPGINGYEATRIIKGIRSNLPIIAQTANAMSNEKEKAIQMGCDDYVSKPYNFQYLLSSIEKLIT